MISELVDDSVAAAAPRPRTWVAPLMSSVVTLPVALLAYVNAAAVRFGAGAEWAFTVFGWGLTVALLTLATAWLLPWEERFMARRRGSRWRRRSPSWPRSCCTSHSSTGLDVSGKV